MPEETVQDQEQVSAPDSTPQPAVSSGSSSSSLKSIWVMLPLLLVVFGGVLYYYMAYFMEQEPITKPTDNPNVQKIIENGELVIGTDTTYPPMEYYDEEGNLVGHDIEFGQRLAQEFGVEARFVSLLWDDIFTVLENEEIDIILSSVSITDERKELYDFSIPYLNAGQVIITQKTDTSISNIDDLRGKKIGVQVGTTNEEQALLYTEPENVIAYPDYLEATQALVDGNVHAIFSDLTNAKSVIIEHETLKIASDPFTSEHYGIVVKKGKQDLVDKLNDAINSLRQKGFLELLKQKWLE